MSLNQKERRVGRSLLRFVEELFARFRAISRSEEDSFLDVDIGPSRELMRQCFLASKRSSWPVFSAHPLQNTPTAEAHSDEPGRRSAFSDRPAMFQPLAKPDPAIGARISPIWP